VRYHVVYSSWQQEGRGARSAIGPPKPESTDELLYLLTRATLREMSTLRGTRVLARIRVREPAQFY